MKYELTIILSGKATAAKKKASIANLEKLVKALKGKLGKVDDWGEITLAYQINGDTTGNFLHFPLELDVELAKQLPTKLNLEEGIIRYLLVKVNAK